MDHWQVRAELENGAVMLFGARADSDTAALAIAQDRLAQVGQFVMEVDVCRLDPSWDR